MYSCDESGRAFLDLDPELFKKVLNWLRTFVMCPMYPSIPEPDVPEGMEEEFMVGGERGLVFRHSIYGLGSTLNPM